MVECASVSRASDPKRPATGSGPFPSESQTWIAAVIDSNPLLCQPRVRAPQHAATKSVGGAEETFRRVHALLSRCSQTAPICSPVSSHAALAKCQERLSSSRIDGRYSRMLNGLALRNGFEGAPKVRKNRFEYSATPVYKLSTARHYPVINWYSWVLTSDLSSFGAKYWISGNPWDYADDYMKRSVISLVKNVKTPTLLMTGEEDFRTPFLKQSNTTLL